MRRSNYEKLVDQYLKGELSGAEKKKFEAWLDMKKTKRTEDLVLTKDDEERIYREIISRAEGIRSLEPLLKKPTRWPMIWAATIALLVSVGAYAIWINIQRNVVPVAVSENQKMILNDGSIVWLRGDSKLFYSESAIPGKRFAKLDGEAFFEVAKNPDKPFVIECESTRVSVLGTAFNLKSRHDSVELIVMSGKVRVERDEKRVELTSGQHLVIAGNGDLSPVLASQEEKVEIIRSTEYDMKFNDATLIEITKRISKKFDIEVTIVNTAAAACHLTGDFTDCSLTTTLSMISEVLDITYIVTPGSVKIDGTGCTPN